MCVCVNVCVCDRGRTGVCKGTYMYSSILLSASRAAVRSVEIACNAAIAIEMTCV